MMSFFNKFLLVEDVSIFSPRESEGLFALYVQYVFSAVGLLSILIGLYCLIVVLFSNKKDIARFNWYWLVLKWCILILVITWLYFVFNITIENH